MRIVWNPTESWFEAELSQTDWQSDKDSVQAAGFKTLGPPTWTWYTAKSSSLNKLKKLQPKSGIVLTELALSKYKEQEKAVEAKAALKKQYKKLRTVADQDAKAPKYNLAVDPDMGYTYLVVEPKKPNFVWTPPRYNHPEVTCIICGDSLYVPDYPDICLWCDKHQKDL